MANLLTPTTVCPTNLKHILAGPSLRPLLFKLVIKYFMKYLVLQNYEY